MWFLLMQAIGNGLDAVRKIARDKHLSGVYGPIIDNFTCDTKVFTAVEVTAGNRLAIIHLLVLFNSLSDQHC